MSKSRENKKLAYSLLFLAVAMLCLSYAAVPLYNLFCKATGFGGTTQVANSYSQQVGNRKIKVFFDSNTDANLPWEFTPKQRFTHIKTGENALVFYLAENFSDEDIIGTAVYNITPDKAALYFNKIHCFCFEEQLLKAGKKMILPVSFYIDPKIEQDSNLKDVSEITLSYSFYKIRSINKE